MTKSISIYAPATMANITVGFDILGAAISPINGTKLGDVVSIEASNQFELSVKGRFVDKLPVAQEQNIVYQCWDLFCKRLGKTLNIKITLEKNMPIGSGLGSSACSVVAGLVALNEYSDKPFTDHDMLMMMGELEGAISGGIHYDNVAPCYLGGLQLIIESQNAVSQSLPIFDDWFWVMAYPGITVATAQARSILPLQYSKADIIDHGRCCAGFIHACYTKQPNLAIEHLKDQIAEPYRRSLLPHFDFIQKGLKDIGALASGISGSGPTLFAITDSFDNATKIEQWLIEHYLQNQDGFTHICQIDPRGARAI